MKPYTAGMTDFETALEECEYQGLWFAEVPGIWSYIGAAVIIGSSVYLLRTESRQKAMAAAKTETETAKTATGSKS